MYWECKLNERCSSYTVLESDSQYQTCTFKITIHIVIKPGLAISNNWHKWRKKEKQNETFLIKNKTSGWFRPLLKACGRCGRGIVLRRVVGHNAKPFKLNVAPGLAAHNSEHYQNSSSRHHAIRKHWPKSTEVQLSFSTQPYIWIYMTDNQTEDRNSCVWNRSLSWR